METELTRSLDLTAYWLQNDHGVIPEQDLIHWIPALIDTGYIWVHEISRKDYIHESYEIEFGVAREFTVSKIRDTDEDNIYYCGTRMLIDDNHTISLTNIQSYVEKCSPRKSTIYITFRVDQIQEHKNVFEYCQSWLRINYRDRWKFDIDC